MPRQNPCANVDWLPILRKLHIASTSKCEESRAAEWKIGLRATATLITTTFYFHKAAFRTKNKGPESSGPAEQKCAQQFKVSVNLFTVRFKSLSFWRSCPI